ncbi:MAG: uroporphyrinogen decarboxylase [Deltaproteobacteria bacterium GWA2_38_16]|nr:MAG: uroporphyrinogen decarboxylase [Deltaproteobacteria bacterium GWA2_38_16]OGQ03617.1 MAG: uroporphyrinogen decarboxylase [Deltaproteobacteria bacterium RIFCSPHIGHO2_02_FULL_38_15]OGQ35031.1 MAG: uroporphyrinogen decarboxylase [Deltaproteobacteria bacterium RIFCSPLOWO2_01_FULL_38_9]HBQ21138.1 uroporphyrinogen decarboxylase [Deltaproteobacteria bacterium]
MSSKLLLNVAQGKMCEQTPIWLMRQAGRYLKEYQELKEKYTFLELCKTPSLAAQISLQPYHRFQMDGVILFSDIMIPVEAMGMELDFNPGPVLQHPIKNVEDIQKLKNIDPREDTPFVLETLKILKQELSTTSATLIGFCGAPFTTASYMVSDFKQMIKCEPKTLHLLLDTLTETLIAYLRAQIDAGAEVVQIFDTNAALLTSEEYMEFAYPYEKRMLEDLKEDAPIILFVKGSQRFLERIKLLESSIVSIDHGMSLRNAREILGEGVVLQGNLSPEILQSGTKEDIRQHTESILQDMQGQKHIFNLGHGVLKDTPADNVKYLVDIVREGGWHRRRGSIARSS